MFKLCIALAAVVAIAAGKPNWPLYPAASTYVAPVAATYSAYPAVAAASFAPAYFAPASLATAAIAPAVAPAAIAPAVAPAAIAPVVAAAPIAAAPIAPVTSQFSTYTVPAYTGYASPYSYFVKK